MENIFMFLCFFVGMCWISMGIRLFWDYCKRENIELGREIKRPFFEEIKLIAISCMFIVIAPLIYFARR